MMMMMTMMTMLTTMMMMPIMMMTMMTMMITAFAKFLSSVFVLWCGMESVLKCLLHIEIIAQSNVSLAATYNMGCPMFIFTVTNFLWSLPKVSPGFCSFAININFLIDYK